MPEQHILDHNSKRPDGGWDVVRDGHKAPSLRMLALEEIRLAISNGELSEGTCYSATALARQLGMSLSPVREAMMSLVSEGTVEAVPNRGFRLAPVSWEELEEIIHIRALISRPAVANLCARISRPESLRDDDIEGQIDHLDGLAREAVEALTSDGKTRFLNVDRAFHRRLLEFGLGAKAASISLQLRDQSRIPGTHRPPFPTDLRCAEELVKLMSLIREGRSDEAQALTVQNLYSFRTVPQNGPEESHGGAAGQG